MHWVTRTGPWQLALCRFSSGIAIGAAVPPIFALAEELIHPRQRRHRSAMDAMAMAGLAHLDHLVWMVPATQIPCRSMAMVWLVKPWHTFHCSSIDLLSHPESLMG